MHAIWLPSRDPADAISATPKGALLLAARQQVRHSGGGRAASISRHRRLTTDVWSGSILPGEATRTPLGSAATASSPRRPGHLAAAWQPLCTLQKPLRINWPGDRAQRASTAAAATAAAAAMELELQQEMDALVFKGERSVVCVGGSSHLTSHTCARMHPQPPPTSLPPPQASAPLPLSGCRPRGWSSRAMRLCGSSCAACAAATW